MCISYQVHLSTYPTDGIVIANLCRKKNLLINYEIPKAEHRPDSLVHTIVFPVTYSLSNTVASAMNAV